MKTMTSKMTSLQLSKTEPEQQKQTKKTTRTGTESQKWRSHGGLLVGCRKGENGGKGTGIKNNNWQVQNRQEQNSTGNGEAKELTRTTHGHELRGGNAGGKEVLGRGGKGGK